MRFIAWLGFGVAHPDDRVIYGLSYTLGTYAVWFNIERVVEAFHDAYENYRYQKGHSAVVITMSDLAMLDHLQGDL